MPFAISTRLSLNAFTCARFLASALQIASIGRYGDPHRPAEVRSLE